MRDSINYNLKYFIMKMSGTKPMKNTMRKPSPLKFDFTSALSKAASIAKDKKAAPAPEGKPASRPKASMSKAKAEMATKTAATVKKNVSNAAKTPMQMKKSGMGKKC
jgi:hypothetical protein